MIKRVTYILLSFLLFIVSTGLTISTHYCGGELKDVSLNVQADHCCSDMDGCCHDESFTVKIKDDFSITSYQFDFSQIEIPLPEMFEFIAEDLYVNTETSTDLLLIPPPKIQTFLSKIQVYRL